MPGFESWLRSQSPSSADLGGPATARELGPRPLVWETWIELWLQPQPSLATGDIWGVNQRWEPCPCLSMLVHQSLPRHHPEMRGAPPASPPASWEKDPSACSLPPHVASTWRHGEGGGQGGHEAQPRCPRLGSQSRSLPLVPPLGGALYCSCFWKVLESSSRGGGRVNGAGEFLGTVPHPLLAPCLGDLSRPYCVLGVS